MRSTLILVPAKLCLATLGIDFSSTLTHTILAEHRTLCQAGQLHDVLFRCVAHTEPLTLQCRTRLVPTSLVPTSNRITISSLHSLAASLLFPLCYPSPLCGYPDIVVIPLLSTKASFRCMDRSNHFPAFFARQIPEQLRQPKCWRYRAHSNWMGLVARPRGQLKVLQCT